MARKGQSITNNITGETIQWLATAKDTAGKYLELAMFVKPRGLAAVNHIHPNQDELFTVKRGVLKIQVNDELRMVYPGQTITVPRGTPHQWWNPSDTQMLDMELRFTPAQTTEEFFEQFFGLCNDGKNNPDGSFPFWRAIAGLNYYDIFRSDAPVAVQRFLGKVLGPIARLLGYRAIDPKYTRMRPIAG